MKRTQNQTLPVADQVREHVEGWKITGSSRALQRDNPGVSLLQHVAGHVREDNTLCDFQQTGDYYDDFSAAQMALAGVDYPRLLELHDMAHHDKCVCGEELSGRHTESTHHLVWVHTATGARACDLPGSPPARPARWGALYATVVFAVRVRLPRTVGRDEVENFIEEQFSATFDHGSYDTMFDPLCEIEDVLMVSDISEQAKV